MAKKRPYPKHVDLVSKTLANGDRVRYGYFGPKGGARIRLGREGTPEFFERLAEALKKEPPGDTVSQLVWEYLQSDEFAKLRPLTQRDYRLQLDKIRGRFGTLSLRAMDAREIAGHFYRWRDSMSGSPRRADYAVTMLKTLLGFGKRRGRLEHNRALGIPSLYKGDRRERVWQEADEQLMWLHLSEPLQLAMVLAVETGLSQTDLLVLPWSAIQGDIVVWRRSKTGVPVAIPISERLSLALGSASRGDATTVLAKNDGLPWEPKGNGFRAAWQLASKAAQISGLTFNDLRGTFITRRRTAGWSAEEVALCSGHPIPGELGAQGAYVDRASVARANALRLAEREHSEHAVSKPKSKPKRLG